MFVNFDLAKKKDSTGSGDERRNIKLSACYKNAHMQNAKPIPGVHKMSKKEKNLPTCYKYQAQLPNHWI